MNRLLKHIVPFSWRKRLREAQRSAARSTLPLRMITDFGQLRRLDPVSRDFGQSRGTPIDRHYIQQFLAAHSDDIRGHTLEVQANTYTRQFGADRVTQADVLDLSPDNPLVTLIADLGISDSLPPSTFDCILCTQTLLLVYDVRVAIENMHTALKPGGILLATVPGIAHKLASREPSGDFWRFTVHSARRLFADAFGAANVEVVTYGNVLAATAFLQGLATEELSSEELAHHDPQFEVTIAVRAVKR